MSYQAKAIPARNHYTMASKSVITLLIFLLSVAHSVSANASQQKPKSAFGFLKHLEGCHKGDNVTGISDLKNYLHHFGYLNYPENQPHANDEEFDEMLEAAVKTYQLNYHLNASGSLDPRTIAKMSEPRCGVADIVNGTTRMRSGKKRSQQHGGSHVHTVSHYELLPGNPRWPPSKYQLTYGFPPGFPTEAVDPVARAFQTWADSTQFRFTRVQDYINADLRISFERGDHQDGPDNAFDGPGNVLAHAFPPPDGRFHYDADETWDVGAVSGALDYETVALHEIGHLLGLGHSDVKGAIMEATLPSGATKGLHGDDIEGIRALYS